MSIRSCTFLLIAVFMASVARSQGDPINGYAAMGASETQGSTYAGSWVPYLTNNRGLDFGGTGNPYNVAVGGATTSTLLSQGQHTEVRDLVLTGDVDLAYLSIGGNDFGSVALDIALGNLSGTGLTNWANVRVNNILTAVDTVLSGNPAGMVVMGIPDMTLTPSGRSIASVPLFAERGLAAINLVNSILMPEILERGLVYVDVATAMQDFNASPFVVGGVTIDMVNASTNPRNFFQDGIHPAAVGNGIMANVMLTAANVGYGTGHTLLSDLEILTRAGLASSYTGETTSIDYASYIHFVSDEVLSVASTDNGRYIEIDSSGNGSTIGQSPNLATPLDVGHDAAGNRYVVDAALSRILKYDANGNSSIFADGSDGLLLPASIEIADSGTIYVANYVTDQILQIDANGNASVLASSANGLESPFGLAMNGSGNLFIAEVDNHRVLMLDGLGNVTQFADATDGLLTPIGLEFDAEGNLYVVDAVLSKILKFDAQGNVSVFADGSDGLLFPTGIAFDSNGNVYVSNYLSDQIIKIDSSGVGSVYANAVDGIEGPFGLDLLNANSAFAPIAARLQLAAVPEASSIAFLCLAALGMFGRWGHSKTRTT